MNTPTLLVALALGSLTFAPSPSSPTPSLRPAAADALGARADDDLEALAKAFESALGIKVRSLDRIGSPKDDYVQRIAAITGAEPDGKAEFFDGYVNERNRPGMKSGYLVRSPVDLADDSDRQASVVLAVDYVGRVLGIALIDEKNRAIRGFATFLGQFVNKRMPDVDSARPHRELDDVTARASIGRHPKAKTISALLAHRDLMREQAQITNSMQQGGDTGPESFARLDTIHAEILGLEPRMRSLLGAGADRWLELAEEQRRLIAAVGEEIETIGTPTGATTQAVQQNCSACHRLRVDTLQGSLQNALTSVRTELGIGDDYFRVGHDVLATDGLEPERAQRLADGIRLAGLLVDAAIKSE